MDAAQHIVKLGPVAVEAVDRTMIALARSNPAFLPIVDRCVKGDPDAILLVEFANQERDRGTPLREAIEKAGEVRFLPVLLTSLTAIGGLMPLVFEKSPLYSPLAMVIIARRLFFDPHYPEHWF
jgi:hypothetical protein